MCVLTSRLLSVAFLLAVACTPKPIALQDTVDDDVSDVGDAADASVDAVDAADAPQLIDIPGPADSVWPYADVAGLSFDAQALDIATAPICTAPSDAAALVPGDPTPPAGCWSWLRYGSTTDWERANGEIAIYEPLALPNGDLQQRHVLAANGTQLQVDEAAPLAEQLMPVGNGYMTVEGKSLQRFDGSNQLEWSKLIPQWSFGPHIFEMPNPKLIQLASGNVLGYGPRKLLANLYPTPGYEEPDVYGFFLVTPQGGWLANDEIWSPKTIYLGPATRAVDGVLLLVTFEGSLGGNLEHQVYHFIDGAPSYRVYTGVSCAEEGSDFNHSFCYLHSRDVWPTGGLLACGHNCTNAADISTCKGEFMGSYQDTPVGTLARRGAAPWTLDVLCEIAGVRPDGSVVGYGRVTPTSPRGWFQVQADGTNLQALPYPPGYVPSVLHRSVSGGMYMAGKVESGAAAGASWVGRGALDGCQPLACSVF